MPLGTVYPQFGVSWRQCEVLGANERVLEKYCDLPGIQRNGIEAVRGAQKPMRSNNDTFLWLAVFPAVLRAQRVLLWTSEVYLDT